MRPTAGFGFIDACERHEGASNGLVKGNSQTFQTGQPAPSAPFARTTQRLHTYFYLRLQWLVYSWDVTE